MSTEKERVYAFIADYIRKYPNDSIQKIAVDLRISMSTVCRAAKAHGISRNRKAWDSLIRRVEVMGNDRPNAELRKLGAIQFEELRKAVGLTMHTLGPQLKREKFIEEKVTKIGEALADLLEEFPPEEEPISGDWRESNLKLTAIVCENDRVTRVIASEEDLKINLRDALGEETYP